MQQVQRESCGQLVGGRWEGGGRAGGGAVLPAGPSCLARLLHSGAGASSSAALPAPPVCARQSAGAQCQASGQWPVVIIRGGLDDVMPVRGPGVVQGPGPPFIGPVLLILPAILILAPQFTRGEIIRPQSYWQGLANAEMRAMSLAKRRE